MWPFRLLIEPFTKRINRKIEIQNERKFGIVDNVQIQSISYCMVICDCKVLCSC
jgi:hypothetical protein